MATSAAVRGVKTGLHLWTPCFKSVPLSKRMNANVFVKMDCMQPSGSFKLRGIGRVVENAIAQGCTHIVSSSGGNAGLATAYAARELGVKATVVVPTSTPDMIKGLLEDYGATAVVHGRAWDEANTKAMQLVTEYDGFLVHPFDNKLLWEGHSTLIDELYHDLPVKPDMVVTVCGGGGLLMGILQGLHNVGWGDVPVLMVETHGASSMTQSLEQGKLVTLAGIDSIAKSLGAMTVSKPIFEHIMNNTPDQVLPWLTSDRAAVSACAQFLDDHRVLVEPACGAGLAALYESAPQLKGMNNIVVQVCGGALINQAMLRHYVDTV
eukprot:m.56320 g.56320  ORF g.56320 m.56320 type:complete len:322 (-) comp22231_c0_seq1:6-971(-)